MSELLRQFFLNPAMLFGTALVSVPIIIYLINRQRYQRRRWAAMEFLLRAMRRNRRRIQLQNLLLLLVRTAVILFLVLAAARPVSRLGVLSLTPDANQNWLLAVDVSYSMGYQEDSRSLFDQARETILQMSQGLMKAGDQVALMTLEAKPRVLLSPMRMDEDGRMKLRRELDDLKLTQESVDLGGCFAVIDELGGKFGDPVTRATPKRVIFFSDLQRKDWLGREGPKDPGLLQFVDKVQKEGGEFAFARLSARGSRPNFAITDLTVAPFLVAKDVWVEIRATIRNFGDEDASNIDLTLRVDSSGDARAEPLVGEVIRIPKGGSEVRRLAYRFDTPGYHTVSAEARSDGLVVDNRRYLAVRVEESVKVLLVDGDPVADPSERETFHLQVALQPDDDALGDVAGRFTPFEARYVTADQLGGVEWKEFAVVVLANVAELAPDHAEALERYVKNGGALMVFLGPNVRPEFYHQYFGGEPGRLLPVKLREIRGDDRYPVNLQVSDTSHPLVEYFEERKEVTHIQRPIISFYKYFAVTPPSPEAGHVRVAFRFNDMEKNPAVFDNAYGAGRVLWFTSTAGKKWNEFAVWPDYVVFLYESIFYLVKFGRMTSNLEVGDVFREAYPASQYASEVFLTAPEAAGGGPDHVQSLRKAMKHVGGGTVSPALPGASPPDEPPPAGEPVRAGAEFELLHEETAVSGLYRLDLKRPNTPDGDSTEYFAVNIDTSESDLTPMSTEDFQTHFETLRLQEFDASKRIEEIQGREKLSRGKEHWKWLVGGLLGLLCLETVLAWLFSRRAA